MTDGRVVAARQQVSCEVGGEVVILNLADEVYYGLDAVGARVWQLIQEPRTVEEVRDAIVAEYEVEPAVAERDLRALLDELASRRLIEVRPSA
ncbi:MAG TPA: PqqD family protein [Longimicrobiaceae bacterium]|nr:PqqD family protein [Longimicrobiaceae bacterium]